MTGSPKQGWQRLATTLLLDHPRLKVVEDDVKLPDGHQTKYVRFSDVNDYVIIVAVSGDKIALTKEYSYPVDEWLWQLPEGTIESGESVEVAAARELLEEAGLKADSFQEIGSQHVNHRRTEQLGHVVLAHGVKEADENERQIGDIEEQGIERHWIQVDELMKMVATGKIKQGSALAAISIYIANSATND